MKTMMEYEPTKDDLAELDSYIREFIFELDIFAVNGKNG